MSNLVQTGNVPCLRAEMSDFKIVLRLPSIELTVAANSGEIAQRAAEEFVSTAFANALDCWDDDEVINDDGGRPLGEVTIEMPDEGVLDRDQIIVEVTERTTETKNFLLWLSPELGSQVDDYRYNNCVSSARALRELIRLGLDAAAIEPEEM